MGRVPSKDIASPIDRRVVGRVGTKADAVIRPFERSLIGHVVSLEAS